MSREIDKLRDTLVPARTQDQDVLPATAPLRTSRGLVTFRYSSTEIYAEGGDLHVKMRETRYQNGRLQSEECEGTLDVQAYERLVREAQGYFLNQMFGFARMLLAPLAGRGRRYDE